MDRSKIKILIDMDDTIENLDQAWVDWLNSRYSLSVKHDDIDCWGIHKKFPGLTENQVYSILYLEDFWKTVQPKSDAVYYVNKLFEDGYDIYLCTNSDIKTIEMKAKNIIDVYFPYLRDRVILISEKQMLKADFLIDDNPDNLIGGTYNKIMFLCPHNKNLSKDDKRQMYLITDSWEDIYNAIDDYSRIEF